MAMICADDCDGLLISVWIAGVSDVVWLIVIRVAIGPRQAGDIGHRPTPPTPRWRGPPWGIFGTPYVFLHAGAGVFT